VCSLLVYYLHLIFSSYFNVTLKSRHDVLTQTLPTVPGECIYLYVPCTSVDNSKLVVRVKTISFLNPFSFHSSTIDRPADFRSLPQCIFVRTSVQIKNISTTIQHHYIIMATLQEVNYSSNDK